MDAGSEALQEAVADELVLICRAIGEPGVMYTHAEYLGAFEEAYMARLEKAVEVLPQEGATPRQVIRVMRRFKTTETHAAVLADALTLLQTQCDPVDPETLEPDRHRVVAAFVKP